MSENSQTNEEILENLKKVTNVQRETNALLENILKSSTSISIISTDLQGNIVYWNIGAENILGYTSKEMTGKQKIDILYTEKDAIKMKEDTKSFILENKTGTTCEIQEKAKDGTLVWIKLALTPRFDENYNLVGILGIGEDITQQKNAEAELETVV